MWSGQAEAFSDVVMSALHSRKRPHASKPEGQENPKKTGYSHAFAAYLTAGSAALDWAFLPFCKLLPPIRSRAWTTRCRSCSFRASSARRGSTPPWCPRCGSLDLRRSSFRSREERQDHILRSPYRCEECGERFWFMSRKVRNATIWMLALVIASGTIALVTAPLIPVRAPPEQPPSAASAGTSVLPSEQG